MGETMTLTRFSKVAKAKKTKVILVDKPDEAISSTAFKAEVAEILKPRKEGLKILSMRENPKGKRIVTQDSDTEKIKASKSLDGLVIKSKTEKQLRPRVIVYDAPQDLREGEVMEGIRTQNPGLKDEFGKVAKITFKTGKDTK